MKIKLHYLPEKPEYSCTVLIFCKSSYRNEIIHISNVDYSEKYGLFNHNDCMDVITEKDESYQNGIVAWAYMDEVNEEVLKHVR